MVNNKMYVNIYAVHGIQEQGGGALAPSPNVQRHMALLPGRWPMCTPPVHAASKAASKVVLADLTKPFRPLYTQHNTETTANRAKDMNTCTK